MRKDSSVDRITAQRPRDRNRLGLLEKRTPHLEMGCVVQYAVRGASMQGSANQSKISVLFCVTGDGWRVSSQLVT